MIYLAKHCPAVEFKVSKFHLGGDSDGLRTEKDEKEKEEEEDKGERLEKTGVQVPTFPFSLFPWLSYAYSATLQT